MKALRFSKFGPPSVLSIEEIPKPKPGDGEALIQVRAAAINPSDVKNVAASFPATTLPHTPGRDFSGIVVGGEMFFTGPSGSPCRSLRYSGPVVGKPDFSVRVFPGRRL
jgi:hypothetical protein